jgi:uncharacterized protein YqjF (DUF2071 family)
MEGNHGSWAKSYESWDEMVTGENFSEETRMKTYKKHRTKAIDRTLANQEYIHTMTEDGITVRYRLERWRCFNQERSDGCAFLITRTHQSHKRLSHKNTNRTTTHTQTPCTQKPRHFQRVTFQCGRETNRSRTP